MRTQLSCPDPGAFFADILVRPIGDVCLSEINTSKHFSHHRKPVDQTSSRDVFFLQIVMAGASRVTQGEAALVTDVGEMSLLDTAQSFTVDITRQTRHLVLEIPHCELATRVCDLSRVVDRVHSTRSIEGQLALSFLQTLFKGGPQTIDGMGPALARQAIDLAALMLTNGDADTVKRLSSPVAVSRLRLHHAVEAHLREPSVRCDEVAGMAGISSRYANVLLAQEGTTLERLIMRRRLEECRTALADPARALRSIGDIARDHGFVSAAHFARTFKQSFGMSAREFRAEVALGYVSADPISPPGLASFIIPDRA